MTSSPMRLRDYWLVRSKHLAIIRLAIPLFLSNAGLVLMQFTDGMFLAKYSPDAIAGSGMSSMVSWLVTSLFVGIIGYTSAITANNVGAGHEKKVGIVIWQGIYWATLFGLLSWFLSYLAEPLFRLVGHAPALQKCETDYLSILQAWIIFYLLQIALSSFFSGLGDNIRLMLAQLTGQILNIVLDYAMIFGHWGFPEMGVKGAAWATVFSYVMPCIIMLCLFLNRKNREKYHTTAWRFRPDIFWKVFHFGIANGIQMCIDASLWTLFMALIGRIGTVELSATSIVFKLNSLSLMPIIGLARGMSTLVGNSHGARNYEGAISYMCHGLLLCEIWTLLISATYVLFSSQYMDIFSSSDGNGTVSYAEVKVLGRTLLLYAAVYSLGDAFNVSLSSGLHAVGDTKWTSIVVCSITAAVVCILLLAGWMGSGIHTIWTIATIFIVSLPVIWIYRIRSRKWQQIRVATD